MDYVQQQFIFGRVAELRGARSGSVGADDYLAFENLRRPLQYEAQHVGWSGIVQKLFVQLGNGRIVDHGHADLCFNDSRVADDSLDRPAHAPAVEGQSLLAVGDGDGNQMDIVEIAAGQQLSFTPFADLDT
jgi:hypothetical protein